MDEENGSYAATVPRMRIGVACELCRVRKVKCNGQQPCPNCWQHGISCVYRAGPPRASRRRKPVTSSHDLRLRTKFPIESTESATPHRSGYYPARIKRQMDLRAGIGVSNSRTGSFQFYGPSSHFNFIQRVYQRIYRTTHITPNDQQNNTIPDGLQRWGLEPFIFSPKFDGKCSHISSGQTFINKDRGDAFLNSYFRIIHPLMPILCRSDTMASWESFWESPGCRRDNTSREIVFMVLSLGARVSQPTIHETPEILEKWSEYFSSQTNDFAMTFQEPSFKVIQFLVLKAMDGLQAMRPNDSYLLLGHAARVALAIGINRSQVVNGNSLNMHRLRVAFWVIYTNERMSALYTGRPSGLVDDHIDVSYPEDLPSIPHSSSILDADTSHPEKECAWIRSMAQIGQLAERVAKTVYSSASAKSWEDLLNVNRETLQCDLVLDGIAQYLPKYLDFFDGTSPVGEEWQEIQRAHLGLNYHMIRMIMHRPALVFASFFASKKEAKEDAANIMRIEESIRASVSAAKEIITICSDCMFNKFPGIRNDTSVAAFLIAACVTVLYDVLGHSTDPDYSKGIFGHVNQGIHCLDQMEHVGPTTGKALSIDVMKCAKDALSATDELLQFGDLLNEFPWLKNASKPLFNGNQEPEVPKIVSSSSEQPTTSRTNPFVMNKSDTLFLEADPFSCGIDLNYTSHWLDGGLADFDPMNPL